jgi:hypothetical protein
MAGRVKRIVGDAVKYDDWSACVSSINMLRSDVETKT